jgi:hypothetical protein
LVGHGQLWGWTGAQGSQKSWEGQMPESPPPVSGAEAVRGARSGGCPSWDLIGLAQEDFIPHMLLMGRCIKGLTVRVVRACFAAVFFGHLLSAKCGGVTPRYAEGFPWRRQADVGESPARREHTHEAARAQAVGEGTDSPHEVQSLKSCGAPRTCP